MTQEEKADIIKKVTILLKEIPSSMDVVKKGGNEHKRYKYLAEHMVNKAIDKDALIVSEDGNGIAILFKTSKKVKKGNIFDLEYSNDEKRIK